MKVHFTPLAFMLFTILLVLSGCTKVNSGVAGMLELDTDLSLVLNVADDINPDEKHSPSPLYIRFYELATDKGFSQLDFIDLYENDKALLGKDLLSRQELDPVLPGSSREESFVLNPETRYVALFAEFYQYKDAKYKVIFPVTSSNVIKNKVHIDLLDNKLLLRRVR